MAPGLAAAPAELTARGAWVRTDAPGSNQASAYFDLRNASRRPVTLVGVNATGVAHASVQATVITRGISAVREMPRVELLAGETVMFQPGGMQVRLTGITNPLRPGKPLLLTLAFADGRQLRVNATVKPLAIP